MFFFNESKMVQSRDAKRGGMKSHKFDDDQ